MDLVFVLATKLDLNVNDMREMLENSMKENCKKFDDLSNKLGVEVTDLSEKITKLEEENRAQTERIRQLRHGYSYSDIQQDWPCEYSLSPLVLRSGQPGLLLFPQTLAMIGGLFVPGSAVQCESSGEIFL